MQTGDVSNEEEEALLSKKKKQISEKVITLLDTKVNNGARFHKESILDVQTYPGRLPYIIKKRGMLVGNFKLNP